LGSESIPPEWLSGLCDFPRSVAWMRRLALRLAEVPPQNPVSLCWPALLPRNIAFAVIVLLHGWRRLFPPYG
jgi:hypothetical protein